MLLEKLAEEQVWKFRLHEGIETDEEVAERFINKLKEIAVAYPGKTVLVVSHGGPIRMFLVKTGYVKKKEIPGGSFKNAGYVKTLSDGVNFFVKDVKGLKITKDN